MLVLKSQNAAGGLLARHMRLLSVPLEETTSNMCNGVPCLRNIVTNRGSTNQQKLASSESPADQSQGSAFSNSECTAIADKPPTKIFPFGSFYNQNGNGQDLRRFLEEVGTDPKEARFWLKHFKRSSETFRPFAIVQVDGSIFKEPQERLLSIAELLELRTNQKTLPEQYSELDKLASTLAFLHRNNMKCVVIHGESLKFSNTQEYTEEQLRKQRLRTAHQSMLLASILENHGAQARPLFSGSNIIQATPSSKSSCLGDIVGLNPEPVYWAMQSDHIPIIQGMGESFSGQLLGLDVCKATAQLSQMLQPRKVLFINISGGITNEKNEVIPNINLPCRDEFFEQPWCTKEVKGQIQFVSEMLHSLPQQSSVVITAANKLLAELFTHHGSGTFFKITEPVHRYQSLNGVDMCRLTNLFNMSFGRDLTRDYMEQLPDRFHTLYLSEDYNAAAIVTCESGIGIPYLDKFAVSVAKQSEGTADVVWEMIQNDFSKLFWRSRNVNPINPWYFKKCEGSWSDDKWTAFWYGGISHSQSSEIANYALGLPNSFTS